MACCRDSGYYYALLRILGLLQQALKLLAHAFELNLGRLNVITKGLFQVCSFRTSPLVLR